MLREGMRGTDQQQNHMFSYLSPETRVRQDHPLRVIRAMVDVVLAQLSPRFDSMYAAMGQAVDSAGEAVAGAVAAEFLRPNDGLNGRSF
jgi:hypothetical protein